MVAAAAAGDECYSGLVPVSMKRRFSESIEQRLPFCCLICDGELWLCAFVSV